MSLCIVIHLLDDSALYVYTLSALWLTSNTVSTDFHHLAMRAEVMWVDAYTDLRHSHASNCYDVVGRKQMTLNVAAIPWQISSVKTLPVPCLLPVTLTHHVDLHDIIHATMQAESHPAADRVNNDLRLQIAIVSRTRMIDELSYLRFGIRLSSTSNYF